VAVPDLLQSRDAAKPLLVRAAGTLAVAARRLTRLQRRALRFRAAHVAALIVVSFSAAALTLFILLPSAARGRRATAADLNRYNVLPRVKDPAYVREESHEFRITLIIPPSTPPDRLSAHLIALRAASYDNEPVVLDLLLAPSHAVEELSSEERFRLCNEAMWTHGPKRVRNATSAGHFDLVLDSWTPARGDPSRTILVDASRTASLTPQFYRYLKSARARYRYRASDIAGFALEPVSIRSLKSADVQDFHDVSVAPAPGEDDVFLYSALPPSVGAFAPYDADMWRAFRTWFASHRAEWFLWPVVVGAKDKNDPGWDQFHGTMRAHWTLWFTRFASEYGLYTLYPRRARPQPLPPIGRASATGALLLFDHYGRSVVPKLSIAPESLQRIIELGFRGGRGSISMTVVSKAFIATARSWICNVETAGIRPPSIVWITTDVESRDAMSKIPHSETVYLAELQGGSERGGTSYGNPGYWLLMLERTRLIREILDRGLGVFAFETDQIWLRDPVPHVEYLIHGGDEVDVVGTLDSRHEIGGNFLYLSPTPATKRLWRQVSRRFERAYDGNRMHKRTRLTRKYMENDQSLLTKLIFFDESFKQRNPVVFRALDTEQFVDGRWYLEDQKFYASPRARSPVLINNNFLVGIEEKRVRAKKHGHWFLTSADSGGNPDNDEVCAASVVHTAVVDNEIRMLRAEGGVEGDGSTGALAVSAARARASEAEKGLRAMAEIGPLVAQELKDQRHSRNPHQRNRRHHPPMRLPQPISPPPPPYIFGDVEAQIDIALVAIESEHKRGGG
jgi:Nucleotide-diphospho-sugar transferase